MVKWVQKIKELIISLHDVDKHNFDRGVPQPNHSDVIINGALKSHKTISSHYGTDADTTAGRLQFSNKQILGNDGTTNITLYGYNQALNKWGFFATQAGTEVTTNTDLSKFIFNSTQDVFKIVASGTLTMPNTTISLGAAYGTGSVGNLTVAHGLGFVPAIIAYANFGGGYLLLPWITMGAVAPGNFVQYQFTVQVDATNIVLQANSFGYAANSTYGGFPVKYFLLQESIAT